MAIAPANAGSRTGLIAWSIISTILFVTALVWAVVSYTKADAAQKEAALKKTEYEEITPSVTATSLGDLKTLKTTPGSAYTGKPLLTIAQMQLADVLHSYTGTDKPAEAVTALSRAQKAARDVQGLPALPPPPKNGATTQPSETAVKTINDLVAFARQKNDALEQATESLKVKTKQFDDQHQAEMQAVQQLKSNTMAPLIRASGEAFQNSLDTQSQTSQTLRDMQAKFNDQLTIMSSQLGTVTAERENLKKDNADKDAQIAELNKKVGRNPIDQVLRNPDGEIIRVESDSRVVINLGQGDALPAGTTFEVYDASGGVPRAKDESVESDGQLKGKASIEVLRVSQGSSECRVTRVDRGQTVNPGDIIANVTYDKNNHFQFVVFGDFNLRSRGEANERDREIIKRLITQWGGQVVDASVAPSPGAKALAADAVTSDTDFVVLGAKPKVPDYKPEERRANPLLEAEYSNAKIAEAQYDAVRQKAVELSIPILNQNRFLYMTGYYDEARR